MSQKQLRKLRELRKAPEDPPENQQDGEGNGHRDDGSSLDRWIWDPEGSGLSYGFSYGFSGLQILQCDTIEGCW